MKVKELLEQLGKMDPEREVVMASDSEGNSYSPVSSAHECNYRPDNSWSGEVLDEHSEPDESCEEAVVLYPTN